MTAKTLFRSSLLALAILAMAMPALAARGSADFTRYVVIGDSYGAGVSNGSLVISHQLWSYPSVIARQVGIPVCGPDPACAGFQQPLVSEPGLGPELVLQSIFPSVVIGPKAAAGGQPLNLTLPRPYNNLSVPGFRVHDLLTVTGAEPNSGAAQFILRGLGNSVQQALAQQPTFMTIWIGGNDVLGAVLAGTPAALTPIESFRADFATLINTLTTAAPNAGMVVGTLPDTTLIPFATTVPPVIINPATGQPVLGPNGQPIFMFADLGGGQLGQLTPGSRVTLNGLALMQSGYGLPPGFPSQLPNAGKPLPDAVVLTPTELAAIRARADEVSAAIAEIAGAKDIPVVDFDPVFEQFIEGIEIAGVHLDASFVTGGLFSLDGFHLTDIGYAFFANEYIKVINEEYGTRIPLAGLLPYFQGNSNLDDYAMIPPTSPFLITPEGLASIMSYAPRPQTPVRKVRPVRGTGVTLR